MTEATYVDANVLISAFRGNVAASEAALVVLGDGNRSFVISDYLRLPRYLAPTLQRGSVWPALQRRALPPRRAGRWSVRPCSHAGAWELVVT